MPYQRFTIVDPDNDANQISTMALQYHVRARHIPCSMCDEREGEFPESCHPDRCVVIMTVVTGKVEVPCRSIIVCKAVG